MSGNVFLDARDVYQTSDGGYVACGGFVDEAVGWVGSYMMRVDSQGDVMWFERYQGIYLRSVIEILAPGGGSPSYMACGLFYLNSARNQTAAVVIRTGGHGHIQWARVVTGPLDNEYAETAYREIIPYAPGYAALVGTGNSYAALGDRIDSDVLVSIIDTSGVFYLNTLVGRATEFINGSTYGVLESGVSIANYGSDFTGDLVVAGGVDTSCISECGPGVYNDGLLLRITSSGVVLWATHYDLVDDTDLGTCLALRPSDEHIFMGGTSATSYLASGASDDMVMLQASGATGVALICEVFGDGNPDRAASIVPTSTVPNWSDVAILGATYRGGAPRYSYLVRRFANKRQACRDQVVDVTQVFDDLGQYDALVAEPIIEELSESVQSTGYAVKENVLCPIISVDSGSTSQSQNGQPR